MSYTLPLPCGCTAYVSCWPDTGIAHTRIIEFRSTACRIRSHERGTKVYLWELLPRTDGDVPVAMTGRIEPAAGFSPPENGGRLPRHEHSLSTDRDSPAPGLDGGGAARRLEG